MTSSLISRILHPDNLRLAWEEVAENRGIAGSDRISIARWRRNWEERLIALADAVRANTYAPAPLRNRYIPKPAGGRRRICIPAVTDRVLQRAVLEILDPLFDRDFLNCSYGYRRGRSLHDALRAIVAYRDLGYLSVLDADIDDFFNQIDHEILFARIEDKVDDPIVRRLLRLWIEPRPPRRGRAVGLPLGSPISPLLSNLYLHPLDRQLLLARWKLVRYADDFIVLTRSRDEAERARGIVAEILAGLRLRLKDAKTRVANFDEGFEFLGIRFYRDTYAFTWEDKEIIVAGDPTWLFSRYEPEGYQ